MPLSPRPQAAVSPRTALSLFELNSMVHAVLQHTLPDTYWLAAEVGEMRVASNGHCYLEFVQKDEVGGTLVAKARGHIWRQSYVNISAQFRHATGQDLRAGLKVLAEVEMLIPSFGFCSVPPCEEFAENVCDEFFSLPLFPQSPCADNKTCTCTCT